MSKRMRLAMWLPVVALFAAIPVHAQNQNASDRAFEAALSHFNSNVRAYGLTNPPAELKLRKSRVDLQGKSHLRFDQFYRGVPVFEGEAIAHVGTDGSVTVTNALRGNLNLDITSRVNRQQAEAITLRTLNLGNGALVSGQELQILPRGERSATDRLVWHVQVRREVDGEDPAQYEVFIDAKDGSLAWAYSSFETAAMPPVLGDSDLHSAKPDGASGGKGGGGNGGGGNGGGSTEVAIAATGVTMYVGNVSLNAIDSSNLYYLKDITAYKTNNTVKRNMQTRDLQNRQSGSGVLISSPTTSFGDGSKDNTDPDTAGADAHFGMMKTLDYYDHVHHRLGVDGAGRAAVSYVHYGRRYENAGWSDSCFCMIYGDGASYFYPLTSLDVAGHEISHGVMSTEANLTYSGESGGLNEANSDIFGTLVEFYAANASDTGDYWIGERILRSNYSNGSYVQTKALRYMDDPGKDTRSPACWSDTLKTLDVHYSSGPANHMFYLLAEGGTSKCNGQAVSGIGRSIAGAIWYKAITEFMTASTNYKGARTAALNAAEGLYGSNSPEFSAVASAFSAINVN